MQEQIDNCVANDNPQQIALANSEEVIIEKGVGDYGNEPYMLINGVNIRKRIHLLLFITSNFPFENQVCWSKLYQNFKHSGIHVCMVHHLALLIAHAYQKPL